MDSHIILILMYLFLFHYLLLFHYYFRHYPNSWYSSGVFELRLDDKDLFANLSKYPSGNIGDNQVSYACSELHFRNLPNPEYFLIYLWQDHGPLQFLCYIYEHNAQEL